MYPEFIAIYVCLAILIVLGVAILILLIKLNKNNEGFPTMPSINTTPTVSSSQPASSESKDGNMAFCKKCATQFSASERFCPKCGTPR